MPKTILFIHGTGVRTPAFAELLALVSKKVHHHLPGYQVAGCDWGDAFGARLNAKGASIPDYVDTGTAGEAIESAALARWTLLAHDPLLELRISDFPVELGPSKGPRVWAAVVELGKRPELISLMQDWSLDGVWADFVESLAGDATWRRIIEGAAGSQARLSTPVARAVAAAWLVRLDEQGHSGITGRQRDELVTRLVNALGGGGLAVGDWFLGKLGHFAVARRSPISDKSGPALGDILRYQARGETLRNFIGERVRQTGATVILAHSLGGVAAVDWLAGAARGIDTLVTAGSQAPYFYEIDALQSREFGSGLPDCFPARWLNFYDPRDLLGFRAEGLFEGRVRDVKVDNGQPFPAVHSAYWQNDPEVWRAIAESLP